jgi:hypothetical protein
MRNKIPLTKFQKGMELLAWLLTALTLLITAFHWQKLPSVMAIHYNTYGIADDWGGRWTVWMLPVFLVVLCGVISFSTRLPIQSMNLPFRLIFEREFFVLRALRDMLCVINLECAVLFSVLQREMLIGENLSMWLIWGMGGAICATAGFGVWRAWKCNQGTL